MFTRMKFTNSQLPEYITYVHVTYLHMWWALSYMWMRDRQNMNSCGNCYLTCNFHICMWFTIFLYKSHTFVCMCCTFLYKCMQTSDHSCINVYFMFLSWSCKNSVFFTSFSLYGWKLHLTRNKEWILEHLCQSHDTAELCPVALSDLKAVILPQFYPI